MSKVFINIGLSLDGYMAPEGMTMENPSSTRYSVGYGNEKESAGDHGIE